MGLGLGGQRDIQYGRQMKVEMKPGKNTHPPHLLATSARYLGTNISTLFHYTEQTYPIVSCPCPTPERQFCSVMLPTPAQHSPESPAQGCSSQQPEQKHPEKEPSHEDPLPLSIHHCQAAIIEHLHPRFHTAIPATLCKLAPPVFTDQHVC